MASIYDEFINSMQLANQGAGQFATGMGQYAKGQQAQAQANAGDQLRQLLPGIMASPNSDNLSQGISLARASGDTKAEGDLMDIYQAMNKANKAALSEQELLAAQVPPSVAKVAGSLSPDKQPAFLSQYKESANRQEKAREFDTSEYRRFNTQGANEYNKRFLPVEKALNETQVDLQNMRNLVNSGGVPSQGALLSIVSRKVAGERGVLTDQDIARLKSPTLGESLGSFSNYIANHSEATWPEDVRKSIRDLVGIAEQKYQSAIDKELGNMLNVSRGNKFLFNKSLNEPHEQVANLAAQYGFEYNKEKKQFIRGKEEKQSQMSGDAATLFGDLQKANKLDMEVTVKGQKMTLKDVLQKKKTFKKDEIDAIRSAAGI